MYFRIKLRYSCHCQRVEGLTWRETDDQQEARDAHHSCHFPAHFSLPFCWGYSRKAGLVHHVNKQNQHNETWRNHLKEDLNDSNQRAMFFPDHHLLQGPVGEEETYCASKKVEQQRTSDISPTVNMQMKASGWKYCFIWIVWSLHTIVQSPNPSRYTLRILKAGRKAFDSRSLGRKCHSKLDYLDRGTHHQEQKLDL